MTGLLRKTIGPAAARFMFRISYGKGGSVQIHGDSMVLASSGRYASVDMAVGRYEAGTTRLVSQIVKPGMVVVDIGAHVGYFTLLAARLAGPAGKIYAFEPEPANHALLKENVQRNGYTNVEVVNKAVSDQTGSTVLFISSMDTGSNSLYQGRSSDGDQVTVEMIEFDSFHADNGNPHIDLMKVDIEGAEIKAIQGMEKLLGNQDRPDLIIEFCPFLLKNAGHEPGEMLKKLGAVYPKISLVDDQDGLLELERKDEGSLVADLMKKQTYVNIFCSNS